MTNVRVSMIFSKSAPSLHALHAYDYVMWQGVKKDANKERQTASQTESLFKHEVPSTANELVSN